MTPKVLLTDCHTRKALVAVRALGSAGCAVHAVSHTRNSAAIYSRFARRSFILPLAREKPREFVDAILERLRSESYDCLIPLEAESTRALIDRRDEVEKLTRLPCPDLDAFDRANDKWQTLELARQLQIPAPKSFLPASLEEAERAALQLGYPLIIKPRTSAGSRGLHHVHHAEAFANAYGQCARIYGPPIVQERIPPPGLGCCVGILADRGRVVASVTWKRLREYPITGGSGTLNETTDDAELRSHAARLIAALNWHGVAMVEFKSDPRDNTPKLMEINPRFWTTLHLQVTAGVNFPFLLYQLATGQPILPQTYRTGVRSRWFLPGDIIHFLANPNRFHLEPSFFDFFAKDTCMDHHMPGDLSGNVAAVVCTALSVFERSTWKRGIFRR